MHRTDEKLIHLVGKTKGKRPLGRPRHRWEDKITTVLTEIGWKGAD
jgi:hypothetical protein